jgi:tRNA (cmo5U34)-methyltransferase
MISAYGALVAYSVAEVSPPMLEVLRERFKKLDQDPGYGFNVKVRAIDLRKDYPVDAACVVLSVLTMCFVPIEHRARVVRSAFDSLRAGGGMIMVEKVLGDTADIDSMLKGIYAAKKKDSGYSDEEIDRKALALEGVLVPLTASGNEDMLRKAGFGQVDCFWRWGNFAGWVAIKG